MWGSDDELLVPLCIPQTAFNGHIVAVKSGRHPASEWYRTLWGHICDVDGRNCASKTDMEMYYGHFITKMTNKPTAHATGGAFSRAYALFLLCLGGVVGFCMLVGRKATICG